MSKLPVTVNFTDILNKDKFQLVSSVGPRHLRRRGSSSKLLGVFILHLNKKLE